MSERLYRTRDGEIVGEGNPDAAFLVVGEGCKVPPEWADAVEAFRAGSKKKVARTPKPKGQERESKPDDGEA